MKNSPYVGLFRYSGGASPFINRLLRALYKLRRFLKIRVSRVVYTVIVGGYDEPVEHGYVHPLYDYICFTDTPELFAKRKGGLWEYKPLGVTTTNPALDSRRPKILAHHYLPTYRHSLYVDANVNILTHMVFRDIRRARAKGRAMAFSRHPLWDCAYIEARELLRWAKDTPEAISAQMERFRAEGFPEHWGLSENNVIYRHHHHPLVVKVMRQWWEILVSLSKRDQLSLSYVLWKNDIPLPFLNKHSYRLQERKVWIPYEHGPMAKNSRGPRAWLRKLGHF